MINIFFSCFYAYFFKKGTAGIKATVDLIVIPSALYLVAGIVVLLHWLSPKAMTNYSPIKMMILSVICGILCHYFFKNRYLLQTSNLPNLPFNALERWVYYLSAPIIYFGSVLVVLLSLRYT